LPSSLRRSGSPTFSSFAIFLKSAFGVLFIEERGIERTVAADLASINGVLGAIGGVLLLMLTERRGPVWIALAPLLGVPLALLIGSGWVDGGPLFIPILLIGGITIGIGHGAVISMTSIYYPSDIRATGGGWASFMAKFAAVAAPIVGGWYFLGDRQAVLHGYQATAFCLALVVLGVLALSPSARRLRHDGNNG
jgi:AAHS family 4-hydroxybenzoate transporter-like MFS transporter